jgi:hypothetical protein
MKICKNCNINKESSEYPKMGGKLCKICFNDYMRLRRPKKDKYIQSDITHKFCNTCHIEKEIHNFSIGKLYKDGYRNICKNCNRRKSKSNSKNYYQLNKEKILAYQKDYYVKNKFVIKNKIKKYWYKWHKLKIQLDENYRLKRNIKSLLYRSFTKYGYKKNSKTENILGCSYKEFKIYIENQFECWMNWNNNGVNTGNYNETWQYDHIIPLSSAKTETEIIKLNHYTNFQPLCSKKNLEKGKKMLQNNVTDSIL